MRALLLGGVEAMFGVVFAALIFLLLGVIWSIVRPAERLWPPPQQRSWQFIVTWVAFGIVFLGNALLIVLDWDSGHLSAPGRFGVGIPLVLVGAAATAWGFRTLGAANTTGLKGGFVRTGPYRFSRNPQYLGDIVLFFGLSLVANSTLLWVTHGLLILVLLLAPLSEELWLEEQYGERYLAYLRSTPRLL